MTERGVGWLIVGAGLLLVLVGFAVASGAFGWFGRLPGDLRMEGGRFRVYIPITSMVLISIGLSLLLYLLNRLFGS